MQMLVNPSKGDIMELYACFDDFQALSGGRLSAQA
jgi:hypothetical protein